MDDATFNGIVIGIVDSLEDPEGLGRVKVRYPVLQDQPSNWARLATPMAGHDRGFRFVPERGEEVLVAWHGGDARQPFILGGLWSSVDLPPPDDGRPKDNNLRVVVSRSGHLLRFDDTPGSERVELIDSSGDLSVILDSKGTATVTAGESILEMNTDGSIAMSGRSISLKADGNLTIEAGRIVLKGNQVAIN